MSSDMLGQIEGTLVGIRVVKAATAKRFERRRYTRSSKNCAMSNSRWPLRSMGDADDGNGRADRHRLVLIFATTRSTNRQRSIPPNSVIFGCLVSMGERLAPVSKVNAVLQRSNAAAQRIFEIIDLPMERRRLRLNEPRIYVADQNPGDSAKYHF